MPPCAEGTRTRPHRPDSGQSQGDSEQGLKACEPPSRAARVRRDLSAS